MDFYFDKRLTLIAVCLISYPIIQDPLNKASCFGLCDLDFEFKETCYGRTACAL